LQIETKAAEMHELLTTWKLYWDESFSSPNPLQFHHSQKTL